MSTTPPRSGGLMSRKAFLAAMIGVVVVLALGVVALVTLLLVPRKPTASPTASGTTPTPDATTSPTPTPTPTATGFDKKQYSTTDPASDWVLVNKQNPFNPVDYVPPLAPLNLPGYKGQMRPEAAAALAQMFAAGQQEIGHTFTVVSPYRSYVEQKSVYGGWVSRLGQAQADRQSARPGYSEHQSGLAVDVDTAVSQAFGATAPGQWIAKNSWRFGFVVRYQEGQEQITGYEYEPWHLRYLGVPLATELQKEGFPSLETFFGYPPAPDY